MVANDVNNVVDNTRVFGFFFVRSSVDVTRVAFIFVNECSSRFVPLPPSLLLSRDEFGLSGAGFGRNSLSFRFWFRRVVFF